MKRSESIDSQNDRSRTVTWKDPALGAGALKSMNGLEYLRGMVSGELPSPPMADLMGFSASEVEEGRVVFECLPAEYHYNPLGTVHGGLAATLFDSAMGCAVHSTLPAGAGYTTLELKVNLLRPIFISTGRLWCEGKTIYVGGRIATAEARLMDEAGKLYGHATTTCMLFREEKEENAAGESPR